MSVEQPVLSCSGSGATEREAFGGDITVDGEVFGMMTAVREQLGTAALLWVALLCEALLCVTTSDHPGRGVTGDCSDDSNRLASSTRST